MKRLRLKPCNKRITLILFCVSLCYSVSAQLVPKKNEAGKVGFVEKGSDKWRIMPLYESATDFDSLQISRVKVNGKYGFINTTGSFVIRPTYDEATLFRNKIAIVRTDSVWFAINLHNQNISGNFQQLQYQNGVLWGKKDETGYAILDAAFQPVGEIRYDAISLETLIVKSQPPTIRGGSLHYLRCVREGRVGICNLKGEIIIPFLYSKISSGSQLASSIGSKNMNKLKLDPSKLAYLLEVEDASTRKLGIINILGEEVTPIKYKYEYDLHWKGSGVKKYLKSKIEPMLCSKFNTFYEKAWLSFGSAEEAYMTANQTLAANYPDKVQNIVQQALTVREIKGKATKKRKAPVIGMAFFEGKKQKGETFKKIEESGIYYLLTNTKNKQGLADAFGNTVIPCEYTSLTIWDYDKGLYLANKGGKYGLLTNTGTVRLPFDYSRIWYATDGFADAEKDGKHYLITDNGFPVKQRQGYDDIFINNNKVRVTLGPYTTYVNSKGEESPAICEMIYDEILKMENAPVSQKIAKCEEGLKYCYTPHQQGVFLNALGVFYMQSNNEEAAIAFYQQAQKLGNTTAASNLKAIRQERRARKWEAIGNALGAVGEAISAANGNAGGSYDAGSSYSSDSGGESARPGMSESTYRSIYSRWESRAKDNYEALTRSGTRTKVNNKDTSGTTGGSWKPHNYVQLKKLLREAQSEMRKTRQEARRAGYNIPASNYENVTVNY